MYPHVRLKCLGHPEPFATLHTFEGSVTVTSMVASVSDQRVRSSERSPTFAASEGLGVCPDVSL